MKYLLTTAIALIIAGVAIITGCLIIVNSELKDRTDEINQLRRERDVYDSLYRKANTRLLRFQDSINIHCICK